jgi:hypothetical protein
MGTNAASNSTNGNINYRGATLSIASLNALNGNVLLAAAVTDTNASETNVTAKRLAVDAATGIGASDSLETMVSELSLSNTNGAIVIQNIGSVVIDRLRTNGNIVVENVTGDVVLDTINADNFALNTENTNALTTFGTVNANYDIGKLLINVAAGNLSATGAANKKNPDITAYNASLTASGSIGASRPLVMYVKNTLYVYAAGFSWKPLYGFGMAPFEDLSTYKGSIADIIGAGAEQLVQVETLDEVNPAIFTAVRNYVYDDIAIMMPADQGFDEKDYEE